MLRVQRNELYIKIEEGVVNLKNVQMQAKAPLAHRFIKVVCDYRNIIFLRWSCVSVATVSVAPVVLRLIRGPLVVYADTIMEFAYAVVGKFLMEDSTIKRL